jgi:glycolate oxidase FAD binding subunit
VAAPPAPGIDAEAARSALSSACGQVSAAGDGDAVDGVAPALVARPGSTEEVSGVLRVAAEQGLAVVPRGAGTKLTWGRPPERADLVLDLSGISGVVDHAAGDLIVEVHAGTPLAEVQSTVAGAGQRLLLDDPVGGSTVGGALATNLSGPGRVAGGTARDLLIGVTLVRADGVVAKAGGRVVKNVAGYDLGKLFCGSRGRLGRVEQVALRLHPLPQAARTVTTDAGRWPELHRSGLVPSAVDVADRRMHVLFEGAQVAVDAQALSLGGDEGDPWEDVRALQARLAGRRRWDGGDAPLVRPGPRVAYVDEAVETRWSPLAERVVEALCSPS